jgi:sugar lactone lactonase YvrE
MEENKMNKNRNFRVLYLALILAMIFSGFAVSPIANAQAVSQTGVGDGQIITHVLARGSPLHGTNGMYFGPDGNLYVGSVLGGKITVMDPNSGRFIKQIVLEQGMDSPDDLTFGSDGSPYWTAITTGVVGKMAPDGTQSMVAQLPPGVNPITFSDDGRLFVALDFLGDGLYEVYLDGVTPPRLIIPALGWLNGFDFGPDGYLYGPVLQQAIIAKIDVDTGEMWTVADDLYGTAAVKWGADGWMYFINGPFGTVSRMDVDSGEIEFLAQLTPGLDNLAIDQRGRLFVSNSDEGFIVEVRIDGSVHPVSPGGMILPGGVAVLPDARGRDNVFVGDFWVLRQFDGQTGKQLYVEREAPATAFTVAADGENLIISSIFDNAVYLYDPFSRTLLDSRFDFNVPGNVIRFQGDLIVAELGTGHVVASSAPGDYDILAELVYPLGLAATDDDLWVTDWVLGEVFQLVQDGDPVMIPIAEGLQQPEGLAVLPDGNLLVVEAGAGRVSKINSETGVVTPFVEGLKLGGMHLSGFAPSYIFNGIAVSERTGVIYLTGDEASVLYRIDIRP